MFQVLIGILKTPDYLFHSRTLVKFQVLIGILKTERLCSVHSLCAYVSSPYRYSKNVKNFFRITIYRKSFKSL